MLSPSPALLAALETPDVEYLCRRRRQYGVTTVRRMFDVIEDHDAVGCDLCAGWGNAGSRWSPDMPDFLVDKWTEGDVDHAYAWYARAEPAEEVAR